MWHMEDIKNGLKYKIKEKTTQNQSASAMGSGALDVFSTPSMIALMEKTSMLCVERFLNEAETTVGGAVNIRHKRATAIGGSVVGDCKVISIEGKKIEFEVSVTENGIVIGEGYHTRFIVNKELFMRKL